MSARTSFALVVFAALAYSWYAGVFERSHVITSKIDEREYRYQMLSNGLRVLLISDPKTEKAAASLSVNEGSMADPIEWPGMAHFLEHMLFLGTEPYPNADDYQNFISQQGGHTNAYTDSNETNYFFDVHYDHLAPALDRFSAFFKTPLFNEEYVEREKNAVDSEYKLKFRDDSRRILAIKKSLYNQDHPFSQFSVGSLETLADKQEESTREALLRFYRENYSANKMTLSIIGRESIEELEEYAAKYFSGIKNYNHKDYPLETPLIKPKQLAKQIWVKTIKPYRTLNLQFFIPGQQKVYNEKSELVISQLLGHEGEGSLLEFLKQKNYATSLSSGLSVNFYNDAAISVDISLTPQGYEAVDEVTETFFSYVKVLQQAESLDSFYQEEQKLQQLSFDYLEKSSPSRYVSYITRSMHYYPAEDILYGPFRMDQQNRQQIQALLSLLRPENMLWMLASQDVETDRVEPTYQAPYKVVNISSDKLEKWNNAAVHTELFLPAKNNFIPENLTLVKQQPDAKPINLGDDDSLELWFESNSQFNVPKAITKIQFLNSYGKTSAENYMSLNLLTDVLNDQFSAYSYPAYLAGLKYRFDASNEGLQLTLFGYQDKQNEFLNALLTKIREAELSSEKLETFKELKQRALIARLQGKPYNLAINQSQQVLINSSFDEQSLLASLQAVNINALEKAKMKLLNKSRIRGLVLGNFNEQTVAPLIESIKSQTSENPDDYQPAQVKQLGQQQYVTHLTSEHQDSSIFYLFQSQTKGITQRAYFGLLGQLLRSPYFNYMRTEKQFGYVASAFAYPMKEVPGFALLVQSPNANNKTLFKESRVFLDNYLAVLEGMSESEFAQYRTAFSNELVKAPQNLKELVSRRWSDVVYKHYDFNTLETIAERVNEIDQASFIQFYRELLNGKNGELLVEVSPKGTKGEIKWTSLTDTLPVFN